MVVTFRFNNYVEAEKARKSSDWLLEEWSLVSSVIERGKER